MAEPLHLIRVPLRADRLISVARRRGLPVREFDDGYLAHVVMRELWQEQAPAPFVLRGRGRLLDAWGYSRADAAALVDRARSLADAALRGALGDLEAVASRVMPLLDRGRRIGFVVRACPVVRLAGARRDHRAGAEVDAFLARCFTTGQDAPVSREAVYQEWLQRTMSRPGVTGLRVLRVGVAAMSRTRLVRRTQHETRKTRRIERPDVRFEGEMVVEDSELLLGYLGHGVGRHRAFGFGALMLTPTGTGAVLAQGTC